MTQEHLKIVQTVVAQYQTGNPAPPSPEYLAEDVDWIVSGGIDDPFVGHYKGRQQVEEVFAIFNQTVEGERHEPKEYIVQGDKVVVYGDERVRFKLTGRSVDCSFIYIFTLREGKIVEFRAMYGYP